MLSLLCFHLPPPPLDFEVETVRGWSNGDISIPPSGTKARVCKMPKTHGTPHSLEKLRFRWDVLGLLSKMVQNLRVVLLKHRKTSGFVYVSIRYINPYINPYKEQLAEWCQRQSRPNPAEETFVFGSGEVASATALAATCKAYLTGYRMDGSPPRRQKLARKCNFMRYN